MSITEPQGFRAAGVPAGIKSGDTLDLALLVNDGPRATGAGVFTTNRVKAAPVLWSQQVLSQRKLRAVVLNSGCANACTGPRGYQDVQATAEQVGAACGIAPGEVAVCSTGLIGELLPRTAVLSGVDAAAAELGRGAEADRGAATAVLTTDTHPKQAHRVHSDGWAVGGFAKGAGMLAPNMATMLGVLTTDAVVDPAVLDKALRASTRATFDRLDVDGGTSTNDTVLVLASGASGVEPTVEELTQLLTTACDDLVRALQLDAEGATKAIDVVVRGAANTAEAERIGRTIAEDNLVNTALFGSDPNWGRIAMALGRVDAEIDVDRVEIAANGVTLFAGGIPVADRNAADLSGRDVEILVDLHLGDAGVTILTTDLSHGYVDENSAYSS